MKRGRIAVVTGGASGIGEAVVRRLCADGYCVAIHYNRSEARAKALALELSACGSTVVTVKADLSDSLQAETMIQAVRTQLGAPFLLVNNAGVAQQKLFTDITNADWQKMMGVNVDGTFYLCRAVLPDMIRAKNGCILNISSMWGQVGASCEAHYSASKAAVIGLTKALAKEVAPSGIRVNCVAPGAVATKMMASFSQQDIAALCEEIPLERLGTPEEIAGAVAFLASDAASYITGQILGVNGGMVM